MIKGKQNFNLKGYNSFGIESIAREFHCISSIDDLTEILNRSSGRMPFLLGGGSNVLLPAKLDRTVVKLAFKEWEILEDEDAFSVIRIGAGWNWHSFVLETLENGLGGMENLSLIPGTVGAAPIQNIGAYGVEVQDFIKTVEFFSFEKMEALNFRAKDCKFSYRNSIFKQELIGKGAITHVVFKLPKDGHYPYNVSYKSLADLADKSKKLSPKKISDWVIQIRRSKLPDPKELGNSGSFFKNPIVSREKLTELKDLYPEIPHYFLSDQTVKIPAAWLIDSCGLKGKRDGPVGSYEKQPLVIVNFGGASSGQIINWAQHVKNAVRHKFDIQLEAEVNLLDSKGQRLSLS
ncbi:MAG: UDP-N-acetylmuramate dehydrogenase [Bacteroidetes bacterium]|nr:UDP-N-acetylmuramate dehydrogenase [Bacteroidota bacterium]